MTQTATAVAMPAAAVTTTAAQRRFVSLAATGAAVVAMAALFVHGGRFAGLPLMAAALAVSQLVRLRLPDSPLLIWPLRLVLFALILAAHHDQRISQTVWFLNPEYISLFGYLCSAELVVRCWRQNSRTSPHGPVMLLGALVFLTATNTFDRRYMQLFAIPYIVLVVVSLRDFRPRLASVEAAPPPTARTGRLAFSFRTTALLLAMLIGLGIATSLQAWGDRVTYGLMDLLLRDNGIMEKLFGKSRSAAVGMTGAPMLGRSLDASDSNSAARVLLIEGTHSQGHFRGAAFDTYDQGRWTPTVETRGYRALAHRDLKPQASGPVVRITRLLEDLHLVYAPLDAAGLRMPPSSILETDTFSRTIRSAMEESEQFSYEVTAPQRMGEQGPLCVPLTDTERARHLAVPEEIQAAVRDLAGQFRAHEDPAPRAMAIVSFLQRNNRYSLRVEVAGADPVSDFVLNKRAAHCQYFASAAVILLRLTGIPARYVTGYYAHELSADGTSAIVRQRDAHAWAECWIDGVGWMTLDATPASGLPDKAMPPLSAWRRSWERITDHLKQLKAWLMSRTREQIIAVAVTVLAAVMLLRSLRHLRQLRRRRAGTAYDYPYPSRDLAQLAGAFQKLLRRRGVPCPAHCTWQEHLTVLAQDHSPLDPEHAQEFVRHYNATRFGRPEDRAAVARLHELLRTLEAARQTQNGDGREKAQEKQEQHEEAAAT